jgi:hypothetical protein
LSKQFKKPFKADASLLKDAFKRSSGHLVADWYNHGISLAVPFQFQVAASLRDANETITLQGQHDPVRGQQRNI